MLGQFIILSVQQLWSKIFMGPEIVDDLAAWSTRGKGRSLGVFIVLDRGVRGMLE